jgi:16S rRNA (cytidine1402-2'-O)-methyltransferase
MKMGKLSYDGSPTLYLIPTPIGNLDDITLRSINILKEVDAIFCEDTRVTEQLLKFLNIKKKLISAHEHNEDKIKKEILRYLSDSKNVALVSDRGTPIISDPGYKIVSYIIENNYNVVGLPGATALIPALITSGLSPSPFLFYGFLNNKASKRDAELQSIKFLKYTIIFYEAPHRITETLNAIEKIFGNRRISISREISKKFEEIYRGEIKTVIEETKDAKGEFVIVVEGNKNETNFSNLTILEHVNLYIQDGYNEKDAIKLVAKERNIAKSIIYREYHVR